MRLCWGDKHHLRKSADRKAQFSPVSGTNAFLICAFRSADFLRWCLSPPAQPHAQSLFLFPIVFGINLIHFFQWEEGRCSRKFDHLFRCFDPLSRHLTEATKNANCFEERNVFGNGKCELSAIQEGSPRKRCKFLARKSAKLFANTKVQIFR